MRRISQQLESQESLTSGDWPLGTPSVMAPRMLIKASALETQRAPPEPKRSMTGMGTMKTNFSDDTSSTFSCRGDWLPDEPDDAQSTGRASSSVDPTPLKRAGTVFGSHHAGVAIGKYGSAGSRPSTSNEPFALASVAPSNPKAAPTVSRHPSLRAKAAGFLQKLRPHAASDPSDDLRFSFQTGEDSLTVTAGDASARSIRKSMSLTSLSGPTLGTALSPVIQSPTTSATLSETYRTSKIPMPVYSGGSLARPRQERNDSNSSLLTASKSEGPSSPAAHSVPSREASRGTLNPFDSNEARHGALIRGNAFAAADARLRRHAYVPEQSDGVGRGSCSTKAYAESHMSESLKENVRPIAELDGYVED